MGLFNKSESSYTQIGFLRLITDYSSYGYLADVFIEEIFQKQGIGKLFINTFLEHSDISCIKRLSLSTSDKHKFYEKLGFSLLRRPMWQMEKRIT